MSHERRPRRSRPATGARTFVAHGRIQGVLRSRRSRRHGPDACTTPDRRNLEREVEYVVDDCFFTVGQVVGTRTTVDYEAVIWWRLHAAVEAQGERDGCERV